MTEMLKTHRLVHITTVPLSLVVLINDQITYMQQQGLEVHGISAPGDLAEQFVQTYQAPFHAVPMTRQISPVRDVLALLRLWRKLREIRPQIVHSHTPKGGLLGILAAWLAGVPVRIYQLRGLRYMTTRGLKRRVLMASEWLACRGAHAVISNSHSAMQQVIADSLCPQSKIRVLHQGSGNGVDAAGRFNPDVLPADTRQHIREKYGIPADALVIGSIGRIVREKGMVEMAAAWEQLRSEFSNLHWLVIGPFETEDPVPAAVRRLLETDPRIHWVGYVSNRLIPTNFMAIDLLSFPSYREGFPSALLEAAAMRVPVVATTVTGCVDAVIDGITGTLVPAQDAAALTVALRRYLNDAALRSAHAQAGRDRVLRDFQPEALWEAIYDTYIELLAQQGIPRE